jgi:preprotein translocase subunit SecA
VLSEAVNDPHHQAACYQALGLARSLEPGRHFLLLADERRVAWLDDGEQRVEALASTLGGAWHNRHHRQELVATALQALHLLHESEHYLVREGEVQLLDAHTGRVADGRKWARSLHTLVELKEGLKPGAHSHTRARCSVQGFFAQYLHLGGMSGTLAACAPELQRLYGARLQAVPLRKPCRRALWPSRLYASKLQRTAAIVARVSELLAQGRPVLVGCASVADAAALGDALAMAGMAHRVLDARHDADEAAVVAQAGQPGAVTVATQMAGRGTDIVLGPGVAACGGLHVINAQDNLDARLDRQLLGRAGRQGDPGSAENWHALDAPAWQPWLPRAARRAQATDPQGVCAVPAATVDRWTARLQGRHAAQQRRLRGRLLEQDMEWQRHLSFTSLRA